MIATPGRLLDLTERGGLLLTGIEILVIDEADRMLDMGFIPDIERICKLVPFTRQTLFFSATMPPEITRLTETFLHNPVRVEVSRSATTVENTTQTLVPSGGSPQDKRATLRRIIHGAENFKNAIIFCNRKRDVQVVYRSLEKHGFSVGALHGDLDQRARMAALDAFRSGQVQLIVCSDVAARGLDIPDVSHVINYDAPHHSEDYVHRIGRTGRAGKTGQALTIVTRADAKAIAEIEKLIARKIDWQQGAEMPTDDEDGGEERPHDRRGRRGERGGRQRGERAPRERQGGPHPANAAPARRHHAERAAAGAGRGGNGAQRQFRPAPRRPPRQGADRRPSRAVIDPPPRSAPLRRSGSAPGRRPPPPRRRAGDRPRRPRAELPPAAGAEARASSAGTRADRGRGISPRRRSAAIGDCRRRGPHVATSPSRVLPFPTSLSPRPPVARPRTAPPIGGPPRARLRGRRQAPERHIAWPSRR